jgi:hypothetical protein
VLLKVETEPWHLRAVVPGRACFYILVSRKMRTLTYCRVSLAVSHSCGHLESADFLRHGKAIGFNSFSIE